MKCQPNALFFSIQRYSKDLAFHLLEFSIHKPTLSPLKLFSIHTSHPATLSIRKRVLSKEKHDVFYEPTQVRRVYKYKRDFEQRLCNRGYPTTLVHKILTEVQFSDRTEALRNKTKKAKEILPFVTTYNPAIPKHWHIIQQQPRLAHIFKQPPIVSYRKEKSFTISPRKTSFNHAAIIKKLVNKEELSKGFFSN